MQNREYSRIFVKKGKNLFKVANIRATRDESVILTLYEYKYEKIDFLVDGIPASKVEVKMKNCPKDPKITFHKSGMIKMMSEIIIDKSGVDRVTLITTPFKKINKPQRIMEIFLAKNLKKVSSSEYCSGKDIILDANGFPAKQLRITIFVTRTNYFKRLGVVRWVSTSLIETFESLERSGLIWTFVLRNSASDVGRANNIKLFIYGEIKHPKQCINSPSPFGRGLKTIK